jgi:hypothetical protein
MDDGGWQAYHTMLVASGIAAWAMVWAPAVWRSIAWASAFAALALLFALRELVYGKTAPHWPWWSLAGLLSVYGVQLSIAWHSRRRWPVWLSAPVGVLASNVWWWNLTAVGAKERFLDFLYINVVFVSISAIVSVLIEIAWRRTIDANAPAVHRLIGLHRAAVWFGLAVLLLAVAADLFAGRLPDTWWIGYAALGALLTAIVASLWDPHVRWPVPAFYCLGLAAVGRYLGSLDLEGQLFTWAFTLALSAFVLATSYLWERRAAIAGTAIRLGAPAHLRERLDSQVWMLAANGVAILGVLLLVVSILFTDEVFSHRMTSAYGVLACALGLGFMASGRVETVLRYLALAAGAAFAVAFAWAWIAPSLPAAEMNRLVAAAVALAATIPLYSAVLVKFWKKSGPWTLAAQKTIPTLAALAGGLLVVTLAAEVLYFVDGQSVPLAWPAILAVALALGALVISSLAAALIPGRDPLGLSERGRTAYVYAAEVLLGLLFLHIRVTMPWLFSGFFARFWPFIVMLIAFVGVGLSEWFARRRRTVLSEPLGNTGVFLPLLPVIGFWSNSQPGQYALLLCAVGALYTTLALLRKSALFGGVAALAFNGGLWTMLASAEGLGLLSHPQFWLIPPAACVLAGAELSRSRLDKASLNAVRYASALMIYAASTADIFINGISGAFWMPMLLAGLALVGVLGGIFLQVRAFLFLGIGFLMVALFSVIWHAAVEQERTWIWWIAGIVTGLAILVLFGLFEKRRDDAQALVEKLKSWE